MWTELPTANVCLDCRVPFSFFFDAIKRYWKATSSNPLPLHRVCTLSRKQGATYLAVECALGRNEVREEIETLAALHNGGSAEAICITFSQSKLTEDKIAEVDEDDLLGQVIVINFRKPHDVDFELSYVFEAILPVPSLKTNNDGAVQRLMLLNNYIHTNGEFSRPVYGRPFTMRGIYYCQQSGQTHVCAHAALRVVINSGAQGSITSKEINNLLSLSPAASTVGLNNAQLTQVIRSKPSLYAEEVACANLKPQQYISILASIIESGDMALLGFTTGPTAHIVAVFGHTRNTDEWHPQAIPAYAGPQSAQYYPSSAWIDHFVVNDDNFGPYYTLSSRVLEVDPSVKADLILGVRPVQTTLLAHLAELGASIALNSLLRTIAAPSGAQWLTYIIQQQPTFVLRPILLTKAAYKAHLQSSVAHDGSVALASETAYIDGFPDIFWMVEYSLPPLYTGNRSKLGEVFLHASMPGHLTVPKVTLGVRTPNFFFISGPNGFDPTGSIAMKASGISAHMPIYQHKPHSNEW